MKDTQPSKKSKELTTAEGVAIAGNLVFFIAMLSALLAAGELTLKKWEESAATHINCESAALCELQQLVSQLEAVLLPASLTAVLLPATMYLMYRLYLSMEKGN